MRECNRLNGRDPGAQIEALKDFYVPLYGFLGSACGLGHQTLAVAAKERRLVKQQTEALLHIRTPSQLTEFLFTPTDADFPDTAPWRFLTHFSAYGGPKELHKIMGGVCRSLIEAEAEGFAGDDGALGDRITLMDVHTDLLSRSVDTMHKTGVFSLIRGERQRRVDAARERLALDIQKIEGADAAQDVKAALRERDAQISEACETIRWCGGAFPGTAKREKSKIDGLREDQAAIILGRTGVVLEFGHAAAELKDAYLSRVGPLENPGRDLVLPGRGSWNAEGFLSGLTQAIDTDFQAAMPVHMVPYRRPTIM